MGKLTLEEVFFTKETRGARHFLATEAQKTQKFHKSNFNLTWSARPLDRQKLVGDVDDPADFA
jgi:hypothetical protein